MSELKKIDYRELSEKAPQEAAPAAPIEQAQRSTMPEGEEKLSFFGSLANRLSLMSKKEKIEVLVLVVVVASIVAVAVYYFSNQRPEFNPKKSYSPPAVENWQAEK